MEWRASCVSSTAASSLAASGPRHRRAKFKSSDRSLAVSRDPVHSRARRTSGYPASPSMPIAYTSRQHRRPPPLRWPHSVPATPAGRGYSSSLSANANRDDDAILTGNARHALADASRRRIRFRQPELSRPSERGSDISGGSCSRVPERLVSCQESARLGAPGLRSARPASAPQAASWAESSNSQRRKIASFWARLSSGASSTSSGLAKAELGTRRARFSSIPFSLPI